MLEALRKYSFKKALPGILIPGLLGLLFLFASAYNIYWLIRGPIPIQSLPVDQLKGQFVSVEVNYLPGCYASKEETSASGLATTVKAKQYLLPVGEREWMGLELSQDALVQGEAIWEASQAYLMGKVKTLDDSFQMKGFIRAMNEDELHYYRNLTEYYGIEESLALPLILSDPYMEGGTIFCMFIVLILFGISCFFLIRALMGNYQDSLKQYCADQAVPEQALEELENFYAETPELYGYKISSHFILYQQGAKTRFFPAKQIVWAYQRNLHHYTYSLYTGVTYGVVLYLSDGTTHIGPPMGEPEAQSLLNSIFNRIPHVLIGYNKEWEAQAKKAPSEFLMKAAHLADKQHQENRFTEE